MPKNLAIGVWLCGWALAWVAVLQGPGASAQIAPLLSLLFGVSGVVAGLYLFVRGFQLLQRKKLIEDTPITKIAAAPMGPVKVLGKATGPYTLLSPLGMVDCHYYRDVAWNGRDSQDEEHTEGRVSESMFTPLFVEDETGALMIDPRGAQLELPPAFNEEISGSSMSECSRRFLHRHGLSTSGDTTVTEYTIKPGDPLLVLGTLAESGAEENALPCLHREAADLQRREQLEAMGIPGRDMPRADTDAGTGSDPSPRVVLSRGQAHLPFLLSRQHPQRVVDDLQRRSLLGIWGGPILTLLSATLLMKWLGVW